MRHKTIRAYAIELLLRVERIGDDGREVGSSYESIRRKLIRRTITYGGPHKGNQCRMTIKELKKIAYALSRDGTRLPTRPRKTPNPDSYPRGRTPC